MALRDLVIFNRAATGIRDTVQSISSIRRARQDQERKDELNNLTIQEKKLQIQKQSLANNMTGMEQRFLESQLAELEKTSKAENTAISGKIDIAEMQEKNKLGQLQNVARTAMQSPDVMASLMGVQPEGGVQEPEYSTVARNLNPNLPRVSYRKNIGPFSISTPRAKASSDKVSVVDQAMGAVDAGGIYSNGIFNKFKDRTEAERYMSTKLGYGWQQKYPQATQIINKKYTKLPSTITKSSEALQYLTTQAGMSREEAVQWLNTKNKNSKTVKVK